ncbi:hypothetical protein T492DRAFT_867506 [Pavlovales sp. CCMP2436]|nr:hypothetical protein T492DRAFT_867506 [Pavlovales sp. CCMP2436]
MWGWSGRNTPVSLAALKGPTSDRSHELGTLDQMAQRLNSMANMSKHGLSDGDITKTMVDQGYRKLADEHLADYKVQADADMYEGFSAFLSGDLQKDTTGKYVGVPFVGDRGMLRHIQDRSELADLQVLDNVQAKCVPWEDHHLLHIPGAHEFLTNEYRQRKHGDDDDDKFDDFTEPQLIVFTPPRTDDEEGGEDGDGAGEEAEAPVEEAKEATDATNCVA